MADRLQVNFPPYVEIFTGHKVNMVGKFYPIRSAIVDNDAKGISVLKGCLEHFVIVCNIISLTDY